MAVLDIEGGDTAVVSAVRRQRRVGALFIGSVAWIVLIVACRHLRRLAADRQPHRHGPAGQAVRRPAARTTFSAPTISAATSSRA